jgi:hypothetical protein
MATNRDATLRIFLGHLVARETYIVGLIGAD